MGKEFVAKSRNKRHKFYVAIFIVLSLYVISIALPIFFGLFTALKSHEEFRSNVIGLPIGAPWEWQWQNFIDVTEEFWVQITVEGLGRFKVTFVPMLINTIEYAVGSAIIQGIVPCTVAYLTSKFNYKFSKFIYSLVIVLMVVPIVGSAPSEMAILHNLNLFDTMIGNFIQKFNFLGMFYLIFYAAFKGVPNDLFEAAYVDGASEFRVMLQIAMPMVRTVLGTVILLKFIDFWNDFQTPMLYLPSYATLARGLFSLSTRSQGGTATVPGQMAGCMLLALPILVLFIIFKDKLMGNLSMGGVKE